MLSPVDKYTLSLAKELSGKRCLITGASGFLGTNMIATLLAVKAEVHITVHRIHQQKIPMGEFTISHTCDLGSLEDVNKLFLDVQPEYIFHFSTARGDPIKKRNTYVRNNIIAADNIIQASLKCKPIRIVVAQSSLEYGPYNYPVSEKDILCPNTLHGSTKAAASLLFQEAAQSMNLPIVILRIFSVYGYWEPWKRLIPTTMQALVDKKSLALTDKNYRRDFIFITDVIDACILSALNNNVNGEIFNIGSGVQTGNKELVKMIEKISGLPLSIDESSFKAHLSDTEFWCANNKKASELLRWNPRYSLRNGLEETWKWFQEIAPKHFKREV